MTENEFFKEKQAILKTMPDTVCLTMDEAEIMANALEEVQQYRAIGTVDEFKALKENWLNKFDSLIEYRKIGTPDELKQLKENGAFTGVELAQLAAMQMKLKEYQTIGTVEECRAAVEKMNR